MALMYLHCVVGDDNTHAYSLEMFRSAKTLADRPRELRLVLHVTPGRGSTGHALGLQDALKNSSTPELRNHTNVIVDSDVCFLMKGWDAWLEAALLQHSAVGATYEDVGGFSSGRGPIQTYKKRPNMVLFAWLPDVEMRDFDPFPMKEQHLDINNEVLAERYHLPEGSWLLRDVGWQLPGWLDSQSIRGLGLQNVRLCDHPQFKDVDRSCEMFIAPDGTPFAAHQRGSSRSPFRGDTISRGFYEACDRWISRTSLALLEEGHVVSHPRSTRQ